MTPTDNFDADDETRELLRAVDPARSLPTADPTRVTALLEETMSQPTNEPTVNRSRWLLLGGAAAAAVVATVVAIGVTGGDDGETPSTLSVAQDLPTTGTVTELTSGPAIAAKCAAPTANDAKQLSIAFEGIVTEVADGVVTLAPTRFYNGTETNRVTIAAPDQGMSEAPAEFVVGEDYLVGADNAGRVAICGLTGPADDAIREIYEEAFGK